MLAGWVARLAFEELGRQRGATTALHIQLLLTVVLAGFELVVERFLAHDQMRLCRMRVATGS